MMPSEYVSHRTTAPTATPGRYHRASRHRPRRSARCTQQMTITTPNSREDIRTIATPHAKLCGAHRETRHAAGGRMAIGNDKIDARRDQGQDAEIDLDRVERE